MKNAWSCSSLLLRIRNQYLEETRCTYLASMQKKCYNLWWPFVILLISQSPSQLYNAWEGPFPMNLKEFRTYIETPIYKLDNYTLDYFLHLILFPREYVQIELAENAIDESMKNTLRVLHGDHSDGKLLYVFNRVVEPTIDTRDISVFVKFAANDQSYWQIRYPYHFPSFTISTLQCIVKQLTNSSTEYMHSSDKSIYINQIEQMYDKNPKEFNKKVIKKCGIIIGYRYRPSDEYVFPTCSHEYHHFSEIDRAFDASYHYTCYVAYIVIGIFICFLLKNMIEFIPLISQLIYPPPQIMDLSIQEQMKQSSIASLENLDALLFETSYRNTYYERLFIVHDKYLVMLLVDLKEKNEKILRQFYEHPPLIILPINSIRNVRSDCIVLNTYDRPYMNFPVCPNSNRFQPANWLHKQLMILNDQYRYNCKENEHFLESLIQEETRYQLDQNRNNISRIWNPITSASPYFIAQFRLADQLIVTHNLVGTPCTICLESFQLNQYFVEWPCAAQHTFHFYCMLNVLRTRNTCPLCRHPVEAADLPIVQ